MRRLKTVRRPPIYPKTPGHLPCSSLTHPLPLSSRRPSVSFGGFGLSRDRDVKLSLDLSRPDSRNSKCLHQLSVQQNSNEKCLDYRAAGVVLNGPVYVYLTVDDECPPNGWREQTRGTFRHGQRCIPILRLKRDQIGADRGGGISGDNKWRYRGRTRSARRRRGRRARGGR